MFHADLPDDALVVANATGEDDGWVVLEVVDITDDPDAIADTYAGTAFEGDEE